MQNCMDAIIGNLNVSAQARDVQRAGSSGVSGVRRRHLIVFRNEPSALENSDCDRCDRNIGKDLLRLRD